MTRPTMHRAVGVGRSPSARGLRARPAARSAGFLTTAIVALALASAVVGGESPLVFRVRVAPEVCPRPVTGRLLVFASERKRGAPMRGPSWFRPEPFFGMDVREVVGGGTIDVDHRADGFPEPLDRLPAGKYRVQALLDHDFYNPMPADGPGNLHSEVVEVAYNPAQRRVVELTLDRVIPETAFPESERVREVVVSSKLLADFHGREVLERAGVALPKSYAESPERRYPVLYLIPGFGGSHRDVASLAAGRRADEEAPVEFIYVMLSGRTKWGHHVYADSATNGPRGRALIEEMIPEIDRRFRTVAEPTARFVGGHSSGGWSSLWLQVTYPEAFGGCWSTAPDPVDFRDFQRIDLYADPPQNAYVDSDGSRRPLARTGDQNTLFFDSFTKMEDVLGRGGQLRSFEAVFSPLDAEGLPRKLYDRTSGRIDPDTARAWQPYDIRLKLERNWSELGPKLTGKLHVTMGEEDTFFLDGAARKLAEALKALGSDAEVTMVPGANHMNLMTAELAQRRREQMTAAFLKHHPPAGPDR